VSWLAELPVIRAAAHAPTAAAPATLTAITLAAASVLGVVVAPEVIGPVDAGPAHVVAAAPESSPRSSPGPEPAPQPATAPPTDVLAEQVVAPAASAPVAVAVDPLVPAVDDDGTGLAVLEPASVGPNDVCIEIGPVSRVVDGALEPTAAAIAPPLGAVVDTLDCTAVVPVETLLGGLLGS
jgi:hypothetical protein